MIIPVWIWEQEKRHTFCQSVQVSLQQSLSTLFHKENNSVEFDIKKIKIDLIEPESDEAHLTWSEMEASANLDGQCRAFRILKLGACLFLIGQKNLTDHNFTNSQFQLPFSHSDIAKQKFLWRCPCALVKLGMWTLWSIPNCLKSYVSHEICNFACRCWQWYICKAEMLLRCLCAFVTGM